VLAFGRCCECQLCHTKRASSNSKSKSVLEDPAMPFRVSCRLLDLDSSFAIIYQNSR
jgi:hypothetical protein